MGVEKARKGMAALPRDSEVGRTGVEDYLKGLRRRPNGDFSVVLCIHVVVYLDYFFRS